MGKALTALKGAGDLLLGTGAGAFQIVQSAGKLVTEAGNIGSSVCLGQMMSKTGKTVAKTSCSLEIGVNIALAHRQNKRLAKVLDMKDETLRETEDMCIAVAHEGLTEENLKIAQTIES